MLAFVGVIDQPGPVIRTIRSQPLRNLQAEHWAIALADVGIQFVSERGSCVLGSIGFLSQTSVPQSIPPQSVTRTLALPSCDSHTPLASPAMAALDATMLATMPLKIDFIFNSNPSKCS